MDLPELTPWKGAMLIILPLLARGPKLRAWLAVFAASVLAFVLPLKPEAYLAIDLACGALVLARPAGLPQKTIGLLFAIMAVIDMGYMVSPQLDHGMLYYQIMLILGWVQFAVLAAWGSYDAGKLVAHWLGFGGRPVSVQADIR